MTFISFLARVSIHMIASVNGLPFSSTGITVDEVEQTLTAWIW
jgi:hypothetical protein